MADPYFESYEPDRYNNLTDPGGGLSGNVFDLRQELRDAFSRIAGGGSGAGNEGEVVVWGASGALQGFDSFQYVSGTLTVGGDGSPAATVEIVADNSPDVDPILFLRSIEGTNEGFRVLYDNSSGDTYIDNMYGGTDSDPAIRFRTKSASTPLEAFTIAHSGWATFGTSPPTFLYPFTVSYNNSSWAARISNTAGAEQHCYISHGSGYGMSIRNDSATSGTYLLQLYNSGIKFHVDGEGWTGVGTTPLTNLHVRASALSGFTLNPGSPFLVESSGNDVIEIAGGNTSVCGVLFSDQDDWAGYIRYSHSDNSMRFYTAKAEGLAIYSDGSAYLEGNFQINNSFRFEPVSSHHGATYAEMLLTGESSYRLLFDYGSHTLLNSVGTGDILFRNNNSDRMIVYNNGGIWVIDQGVRAGAGIQKPMGSSMVTDFSRAGLLLYGTWSDNQYLPGLAWGQSNVSGNPVMGIWGYSDATYGTWMYLGTSNAWASGITNMGLAIDYQGYVAVGIAAGNPTIGNRFYVNDSISTAWVARFRNALGNQNGYGVEISCGQDTPTTINYWMKFSNRNTTAVGYVRTDGSGSNIGIYASSDINKKKDIGDTQVVGLDVVNDLSLKEFRMKEADPDSPKIPIGFIAQDCQSAFPEMVDSGEGEDSGTLFINQQALIPVLTKALQEAHDLIEGLEARVAALEA